MKLEFCIDDFCGILRLGPSTEGYYQQINDILRVGKLKNGKLVYYTDSTIVEEVEEKLCPYVRDLEPPEKWYVGEGELVRIGTPDDCELLRSRWGLINAENDKWHVRLIDWISGRNKKMEFLRASD